jgi:hypothetical protein
MQQRLQSQDNNSLEDALSPQGVYAVAEVNSCMKPAVATSRCESARNVRTPVRHYVVVSTSVYVAGPVPARATLERQLERQLERVTDRAVVLVDCTVVVYGRDPVGTIVLYLVYLIRTVLVRGIYTSPHTSHICLQ